MNRPRIFLLGLLAIAAGLCSLGTASAFAAPLWNLDVHHNETNFPPGGTAEYWFDVSNVGDTASSGPVSVSILLPGGITRESVRNNQDKVNPPATPINWSCPGDVGDSIVTCTTTNPIPRHTISRSLVLTVNVHPAAEGVRFASATVQGGGAAAPRSAIERTQISPQPASFGIVDESFVGDFFEADGVTPERESGSHPDLASFSFDFNSVTPDPGKPSQKSESGSVRNLQLDLPPGFVGAPTAVGECAPAEFTVYACPPSSQVGRADVNVYPITETRMEQLTTGVFNLAHPRGTVADLAFVVAGNPVHVKVGLDAANQYSIVSKVSDINETLPPFHSKVTIWGVPADSSHDTERCPGFEVGNTSSSCSTDAVRRPFLTLPSDCSAEHRMRLHQYDSWQQPGVFGPPIDYVMPGPIVKCDRPRFEPEVDIEPTGKQANTPTGLDVHIGVAQNQNPNSPATPAVKSTTVTLPQGMSFSPSFADGLQACSLAQMKLGTNEPIECTDASRIGEVELSTPLLPRPAEGSMYLAAQGDNPFGSTFALYLVLHDTEERGVLIKIAGRIDVDTSTGQITTVFDDLPQFPFDDMTLKFRSGPRAPLVSPPSCGTHRIGVQMTSYARPGELVDASNTYQVSEGPNGTLCPPGLGARPFSPRFSAGTLNPAAGSYSPFLFRLSREDQEQELTRVTTVLPPGLVAKIAGVPACSEQVLTSIPDVLGSGAPERAHSSCPSASQVGTLAAGLGAGAGPNYFDGRVYLAGPYQGAPLSLAIVAPALAGPFDLGNVVVRAALHVDPSNAQVTAISDPFPTILHGVILRVRDVRLRVDRANTTLNPTNCDPMAVNAQISGLGGAVSIAQSPFQVSNCANLGFKPKLSFRLIGGTHRGAHPKLRATLRARPGDANIAGAQVTLPRSEFLDQGHIGTVCTRVQFAADQCPAASIYGFAEAKTPLLDEPLRGPVYLRSSSHLLPDLVASLTGRIEVELAGRIDSIRGGIRTTFDVVPDAPVSSFTLSMQGGRKGLLVNSADICLHRSRVQARFKAQNGDGIALRPVMQVACSKQRANKKRG